MNEVNEASPAQAQPSDLERLVMRKTEKMHQTVVRVATAFWHDEKGAYCKKSITTLKRKSFGLNALLDECDNGGSEMVGKILNFWESPDGVYEVVVCNQSTDWETGIIDDWDLKLVPFDA